MLPTLQVGGLVLHSWALAVTIGVVLTWGLVLVRARRLGYPTAPVFLWLLFGFPAGALGALAAARALPWLYRFFTSLPVEDTGMTVLGSTIACSIYFVAFIWLVFKEPAGRLLDAAAFAVPLALVFGRLGCLLSGCCFGRIASAGAPRLLTLALGRYDPSSAAALHHAAADGLAPATVEIWNFPLLMMIAAALVAVAVELLYARRRSLGLQPGAVFCAMVLCEALLRLPLEQLREEATLGTLPFNPWQLPVVVIAVVAALELRRRQRSPSAA